MKVKDLIEKLQSFDQERIVYICNETMDTRDPIYDVVEELVDIKYDCVNNTMIRQPGIVLS